MTPCDDRQSARGSQRTLAAATAPVKKVPVKKAPIKKAPVTKAQRPRGDAGQGCLNPLLRSLVMGAPPDPNVPVIVRGGQQPPVVRPPPHAVHVRLVRLPLRRRCKLGPCVLPDQIDNLRSKRKLLRAVSSKIIS